MMVVGFLCLLGGAPALQLALTETGPTPLSYGDFDPASRSERWFEFTDCRLSWLEAGYATVGKSVTEVYVPVRANTEETLAPVRLVLASRRPSHLELGEALWAAHGDPAGMQRALEGHREARQSDRLLRGLWRGLHELSVAEQEVVQGLPVTLARQAGVLDDEVTPDVATGGLLCGVAVLCFVFAGLGLRRRRMRPIGST